MNVLFLVDLHWSGQPELALPDLEGVDLVLLGGDLTHFGGPTLALRLVEQVRARVPEVLAVCGNCDLPAVEEALDRTGVGLDRQARVVAGVQFLGLSAGLPFGGCPYERTEADYEKALEELWAASDASHRGTTVLMSHQPPYGTRCDFTRGRHVGSHAIRAALERHRPQLVLSGHIHEGIGIDQVGESTVANPGPWMSRRCLRFRVDEQGFRDLELLHG